MCCCRSLYLKICDLFQACTTLDILTTFVSMNDKTGHSFMEIISKKMNHVDARFLPDRDDLLGYYLHTFSGSFQLATACRSSRFVFSFRKIGTQLGMNQS